MQPPRSATTHTLLQNHLLTLKPATARQTIQQFIMNVFNKHLHVFRCKLFYDHILDCVLFINAQTQ